MTHNCEPQFSSIQMQLLVMFAVVICLQLITTWIYRLLVVMQVDGLVDHFMRFQREERDMPVVWHQSLLIFVQRWVRMLYADFA